MHELSIAVSIVELVEEEIRSHIGATVSSVTVRIGEESGVVPEALRFAWQPATEGTRASGSELRIEGAPHSREMVLESIEVVPRDADAGS